MKCLTQARGDGAWGQLQDAYFLAEGGKKELGVLFDKLEREYGKPVYGGEGKKLGPLSEKLLPAELVKELKTLPQAPTVKGR
jgi:hypothetical protein